MRVREIQVTNNGAARVVADGSGQTFLTTPHAVALAILRASVPEIEGPTRDINWSDFLSTHGVAVGVRGNKIFQLAVIPRKVRTVNYHADESIPLTASFPPLMIGALFTDGRYERGVIYCFNDALQAQASVLAGPQMITPFPFGNVYAESGWICWGTVRHSDIHNLAELEDLFFSSGFNRDLWHGTGYGIQGSNLNDAIYRLPAAAAGQAKVIPNVNNWVWPVSEAVRKLLRG